MSLSEKRRFKLKQKDKIRVNLFLRPDQHKEVKAIQEREEVYMLDVLEELIDLGLSVYYGNPRNIEDDRSDPAYLYD